MIVSYSGLIDRFHEALGTPKELIEEAFNKPDATDIVMGRYISIKDFGGFRILIVYEMGGASVRFMNAYRVFPKLLDGDIDGMRPLDVLKGLMESYGMAKEIPGKGERKFFVDKASNAVFLGILDIEKYLEAVKNI